MTRNLLLTFALIGVITPCSFAQKTLLVSVDKTICPTATFSSIQDAVNHASSGDTINVCPGTYVEQVTIDEKPSGITIRGLRVADRGRALIKPNSIKLVDDFLNVAAILVTEVKDITIDNISVDMSSSNFSSELCNAEIGLNGIFFREASGTIRNSAVANVFATNCTVPLVGGVSNGIAGFSDRGDTVLVENNDVRIFGQAGIFFFTAGGEDAKVTVSGNNIFDVPVRGAMEAGIIAGTNNSVVSHNQITMGRCILSMADCAANPNFGIFVFQQEGILVSNNVLSGAQTGIALSSNRDGRVTNNLISDIDTLDGVDFRADLGVPSTGNEISGNIFRNMSSETQSAAVKATTPGNSIFGNTVNDAYAGVLFVSGNNVGKNIYYNTDITQKQIRNPPDPASAITARPALRAD